MRTPASSSLVVVLAAIAIVGCAGRPDASALPNLGPEAVRKHQDGMKSDVFTQAAYGIGFYLADGSDPCNWWLPVEPSRPGLVPYDEAPRLRRRGFVSNSNDKHWLSNPAQPLTSLHYLYGGEESPLTMPCNTWAMAMEFTDAGPRCRALMTYGQSEDPESPHFDAQTGACAAEQWRECVWGGDEIEASALEQVVLVREGAP